MNKKGKQIICNVMQQVKLILSTVFGIVIFYFLILKGSVKVNKYFFSPLNSSYSTCILDNMSKLDELDAK